MTKEELKQEAEKYADNLLFVFETDVVQKIVRERVKLALIDVLESREKRIAELEQENAELKENLKTAYRKGMRHMAKALKDYDRTDGAWTDYFEHTVDKVLQREQLDFEEYGTLADQLTKAKKIIQEFLDLNYSEFTKTNAVFLHADKFLKESK